MYVCSYIFRYHRKSQQLAEVFERLHQFNLKIQPAKCEFLRRKVLYLGQSITNKGTYKSRFK